MVLKPGPRGEARGAFSANGSWISRSSAGRPIPRRLVRRTQRRGRGGHADRAARRRGAALRPAVGRDAARAVARRRRDRGAVPIGDALHHAHRFARSLPRSAGSGSSMTRSSWATRCKRPGGDAAVVRVHGDGQGAGARPATARRAIAPPIAFEGGKQAVAEAWRNLTAVGARAARDHGQSQFRQSRAARRSWARSSAASRASARPAGRSTSRSSPATSRSTTRRMGSAFRRRPRSAASVLSRTWQKRRASLSRRPTSDIWLVGGAPGWLGQSAMAARRSRAVKRARRRRSISRSNAATANSSLRSFGPRRLALCHDLSDGGLAIALAEMAMAGGIGASVGSAAAPSTRSSSARIRAATL